MQLKIENEGMNCSKFNCSFNDWVRFEASLGSTQGEENTAKLEHCFVSMQLTLLL
jgi:hypothetical protein